jgi:prevent-host-death family protein
LALAFQRVWRTRARGKGRSNMIVNTITEAMSHFTSLIEKVLKGEDVIISKGGKPIVMIVPFSRQSIGLSGQNNGEQRLSKGRLDGSRRSKKNEKFSALA